MKKVRIVLLTILGVGIVSIGGYSQEKSSNVNTTKAGYSQAAHKEPVISSLRPRLFVRADKSTVGRGITLSQLRSRRNDPAYRDWISYDDSITGWESATANAMQYLLRKDKRDALSLVTGAGV